MALQQFGRQPLGWRWYAAGTLFLLALIGFLSGVSVTERPDVQAAGVLTQAYYSLGLFVVGGLDLGVPTGGPWLGRAMLWIAYFGAPLLTASAVIEAALRVLAPQRWQLRRLRDHVVVVGSNELTTSYLRVFRRNHPEVPVVVVDDAIEHVRVQELIETFGVTVLIGDITHEFLVKELRLRRARKVMLLGDDDFQTFEPATRILRMYPKMADRLVLHCHRLRFMRAMQDSELVARCTSFNAYNFAAASLVRDELVTHFHRTAARDVVVLAGFGRFGQTVLEELTALAERDVETVAIIDEDADRRVLVVDEQKRLGGGFQRLVLQGDIGHPQVWRELLDNVDLTVGEPVVILGTGDAAANLRTALWIKRNWPNTLVFTRTNDASELARQVGGEHGIHSISITELVESNLPMAWLG